MAKAVWNGKVIAESDETKMVEGNHYFPPQSLKREFFQDSAKGYTTRCGWKGLADYYDLVVDGQTNADAAWYYKAPKAAAAVMNERRVSVSVGMGVLLRGRCGAGTRPELVAAASNRENEPKAILLRQAKASSRRRRG